MAIFHLSFSMLKRSAGKSSCYLAAYNARERIEDMRTGDVYDYSYRSDLFHHCILAPEHTPFNFIGNSAVLWNEIEKVEKGKTPSSHVILISLFLLNWITLPKLRWLKTTANVILSVRA